MGYNAFNSAENKRYNPKYGINGRVNKDEFSIDGRSWNYRDPQNKDSNDYAITARIGDNESAEDNWSKDAKLFANPLYDYSYGEVRDTAADLEITNVNNKKKANQILEQLKGGSKSKAEDFKDDFIEKKITPRRENSDTEVEIPTGATAGNARAGDNSIASSIARNAGIDVAGDRNNVKQVNSTEQEQAGSFLDKYKLDLTNGKGLNLS
jgi:hypothetical protein